MHGPPQGDEKHSGMGDPPRHRVCLLNGTMIAAALHSPQPIERPNSRVGSETVTMKKTHAASDLLATAWV